MSNSKLLAKGFQIFEKLCFDSCLVIVVFVIFFLLLLLLSLLLFYCKSKKNVGLVLRLEFDKTIDEVYNYDIIRKLLTGNNVAPPELF